MNSNLKCTQCITEYLQLPETEKEEILSTPNAFDNRVRDAITFVPTWQTQMAGPGQLVMACVTVPICLSHVQIQKPSAEQIAQRNGIWMPGQN
jgi:hypothetical protein